MGAHPTRDEPGGGVRGATVAVEPGAMRRQGEWLVVGRGRTMQDRRLMLVHAHPDDESSATAVTMAGSVADGVDVTLVTCTAGEDGEIVAPDLEHLAADRDDALGPHRLGELAVAMAALGVTDFLRLGGDFRFRDSGMAYAEDGRVIPAPHPRPNAFALADLKDAADELVPVIRDRRPQIVISDDPRGSYGHPDHVMAHRVATYGALLAGTASYRPDLGEPWSVARTLWTARSESATREFVRRLRRAGVDAWFGDYDPDGAAPPPMTCPDEAIAVRVDAPEFADRKMAALAAHRSQIRSDSFFLTPEVAESGGTEEYRLAAGVPYPAGATNDLFAGLM